MKLYEFMAKDLFARYGIPVPAGQVASSMEQVEGIASKIGPSVVKAQVLVGGRGKAGGIRLAVNSEEAGKAAEAIIGMDIKGYRVDKVLVEEQINIDHELYLAITFDGAKKKPLLLASAAGGIEIEEVPEDKLVKMHLDIQLGVKPFLAREVCRRMGLSGIVAQQVGDILIRLYQLFREYDCELVEINPLVISGEKVIAADGKITIDDEALYRVDPTLPRVNEKTEREELASQVGISYVELDGDIAVIANGAGITMATLDILEHYGGKAANFMDAGGGAGVEATAAALNILLSAQPKAILVNIFGGITRCDDVAKAFLQVKETRGIPVPLVMRVVGTNEAEGVAMLKENGIESFRTIHEAVEKVVALTRQ